MAKDEIKNPKVPEAETQQGSETDLKSDRIVAEACSAYGIDRKHLFHSRMDQATGELVLLTNGGRKVRWKKGMEVDQLSEIEITGINPEWKKRKPIAGKKR